MKRIVTSALFLCLIVGLPSAFAQTSSGGPSWKGFYLGIEPGVKLTSTKWTAIQINGGTPGQTVDSSSPRTYDPAGFRAGAYGGFNWRLGKVVLGPEADYAWSNARETQTFLPGCALGCGGFIPPPGPNDTASIRVTWDRGIRGRVGYLVTPRVLLYGTAGAVWQNIQATGICITPTLQLSQYCFGPGSQVPVKRNLLFTGFSTGGGVETILHRKWMLRGEYRFAHFPGMNDTMSFLPSTTGLSNIYDYHLAAHTHTLTAGAAYKF